MPVSMADSACHSARKTTSNCGGSRLPSRVSIARRAKRAARNALTHLGRTSTSSTLLPLPKRPLKLDTPKNYHMFVSFGCTRSPRPFRKTPLKASIIDLIAGKCCLSEGAGRPCAVGGSPSWPKTAFWEASDNVPHRAARERRLTGGGSQQVTTRRGLAECVSMHAGVARRATTPRRTRR
jgi:hypothetical protein